MLDNHRVTPAAERNSRKEPLQDDEVEALIATGKTVLVAKGKKIREIAAGDAQLADLKGPTGNYRAPMVKVGDTLLVGFHLDTLTQLLSS